eukprot:Pgem_evm1s665
MTELIFNKTYFQQYDKLELTLQNLEPIVNEKKDYLKGNHSLLSGYYGNKKWYEKQIDKMELVRKKDTEYLLYFRKTGRSIKNLWGFQFLSKKGLKPGSWFYDMDTAINEIKTLKVEIDKKKKNLDDKKVLINETNHKIKILEELVMENEKLKDSLKEKKQAVIEHEFTKDFVSLQLKKEVDEYERRIKIFHLPDDNLNLKPEGLFDFITAGLETSLLNFAKDYSFRTQKSTFENHTRFAFDDFGTLKDGYIYNQAGTDISECMKSGNVWSDHIYGIDIRRTCIVYPRDYGSKRYFNKIQEESRKMLHSVKEKITKWERETKSKMNEFYEKIESTSVPELSVFLSEHGLSNLMNIENMDFKFQTVIPKQVKFTINDLRSGNIDGILEKCDFLERKLRREFTSKFDSIIKDYYRARRIIDNEYKQLKGIRKLKSDQLNERREKLFELKRNTELNERDLYFINEMDLYFINL